MGISRTTFLSSLIFFFAGSAQATVTYVSQAGASNEILSTTSGTSTTTTKPRIFGGVVLDGASSKCSSTDTSTCATCTDSVNTVIRPCNDAAVAPGGLLVITGRTDNSTVISAGTQPFIHLNSGTGTSSIAESFTAVQPDGSFTLSIRWSAICALNDCSTGGGGTYTMGFNDTEKVDIDILVSAVDASQDNFYTECEQGSGGTNDGFCHVTMYPGDKKAYAENLILSGNSVQSPASNIKWQKVVFFFKESGGNRAGALASFSNNTVHEALPYDNNKVPPDVDGRVTKEIQNNVEYCFGMANMDEAGNIYRATDFSSNGGSTPSGIPFTDAMCVQPDEVVGLLDDKRCFIATAAFGSPFEAHVKTLREFRDKVLKSTEIGREFVEFYYTYSPAIAKWISDRDNVRAAIRVGLMPFVGLATLSLDYGFAPTMLTLVLLSGAIMAAGLAWRRRRRA